MSIPPVSDFFSSVLPPVDTCQIEATNLFGNDLAESLYNTDQSWEKVMLAWNVSLDACKIIKESNIEVTNIYCEIQSNDGLIVEISPEKGDKKDASKEIINASLITPYGYLEMKFKDNESMNEFIDKLASKFYKQSLPCGGDEQARLSFTLAPDISASFKPSYYCDQCGHQLKEEFGENEYTRTQTLAIYDRLKTHANIDIQGQAIV